jgi:hypothetical protein
MTLKRKGLLEELRRDSFLKYTGDEKFRKKSHQRMKKKLNSKG